MSLSPSKTGAVQLTDADASPAVAETPVGAPGSRVHRPLGELGAPALLSHVFAVPAVPDPLESSKQAKFALPVIVLSESVPPFGEPVRSVPWLSSMPLLPELVMVLLSTMKSLGAEKPLPKLLPVM